MKRLCRQLAVFLMISSYALFSICLAIAGTPSTRCRAFILTQLAPHPMSQPAFNDPLSFGGEDAGLNDAPEEAVALGQDADWQQQHYPEVPQPTAPLMEEPLASAPAPQLHSTTPPAGVGWGGAATAYPPVPTPAPVPAVALAAPAPAAAPPSYDGRSAAPGGGAVSPIDLGLGWGQQPQQQGGEGAAPLRVTVHSPRKLIGPSAIPGARSG